MNQRIQEIAESCGVYIAYDNRRVTDAELEFFGELIVQECVDKIREVLNRIELEFEHTDERTREHSTGMQGGMTIAIHTIKHHFGLES